MSQQDPPIVVTGGSVNIEFDPGTFPASGGGRHSNANKKIRRVVISVNGGPPQTIDIPTGKVRVEIHYGKNNNNP